MKEQGYFDRLDAQLSDALSVAEEARSQGKDPEPTVEIPIAEDMADRVENILEIPGVAERVRELEGKYGREEAALELARDFATGTVGDFSSRDQKIEAAVRTAVALLTEGVVAAPIEGIDRVEVAANDDGSEYVRVFYAGPIRSAGGTAQALSVVVADYARALLDLDRYKPRTEEIERYAEEVELYDSETGLQYSPKKSETRFIAEHCPIMLDGEATGSESVDGYRDLERVATNRARGGMCLVLAEGIALKAPKIKRYTEQLDETEWPWLDDLISGSYSDASPEEDSDTESEDASEEVEVSEVDGPVRVSPEDKYLRDIIAGRPVFSHPSTPGGFRLRYGRARNHGFATAGIHPATMHLVDDFLATGTQMKIERPGKAAGTVPVDTIDGPVVKLTTGEVRHVNDPSEALEIRNGVDEILDLGECLINYGEFVENNHPLPPASYVVEWWEQEFEAAVSDVQSYRDDASVDLANPSGRRAVSWAESFDIPLHPAYTYCWHDISVSEFVTVVEAVEQGELVETDDGDFELSIPQAPGVCRALESLLIEHAQEGEQITIPRAFAFVRSLGFDASLHRSWAELSDEAQSWADGENAIRAVNETASFTVRERAPTRIGARMGRPEKSEKRELNPAVHTLFPIGDAGGNQRDITAAASYTEGMQDTPGEITVEVGTRSCSSCGAESIKPECPSCGGHTELVYECDRCGISVDDGGSGRPECPRCGRVVSAVSRETIDLRSEYRRALESVGERENVFEILKGVKGLMSWEKSPEPIEKGILRAKHGVSTFKDGTVRYDMTDLPVTAVRPREINVSVSQLQELGYTTDIHDEPLAYDDQLVSLRSQDVVLSNGAAAHLMNVAQFVDDLLVQYYGLEPFYDVTDRDDLLGELVFGLAPHTSAAVLGRITGFTSAAVGYAHPYFHAAKRRNCFHPETDLRVRNASGAWQSVNIRSFVEAYLVDPERDAFGTETQSVPAGSVFVPSMTDSGAYVEKPIRAVSKHPAPRFMVSLETSGGRVLRVTPGHTMVRWNDAFEFVAAQQLTVGDRLPQYSGEADLGVTASGTAGVRADGGRPSTDTITDITVTPAECEYTYCVTVPETHTVVANSLSTGQCDGDEDCVLLLLDGLLNFSKHFLPDQRGGSMDSPLVMSSRIDPTEIDDEAHNIDVVSTYPLSFYEATLELESPGAVDIPLAGDSLDSPSNSVFSHTHDTSDIAGGPALSAYKTLGSMDEKTEAQLELARKLRAVDEADVAERIIESHFLPDLLGNLRAFSRQQTRCMDCGMKYRRMPLSGNCRECGGDVNLTVHQGSVSKYLETAIDIADRYGAREYTKQRLYILERSLDSIFEDDRHRQTGIADFM